VEDTEVRGILKRLLDDFNELGDEINQTLVLGERFDRWNYQRLVGRISHLNENMTRLKGHFDVPTSGNRGAEKAGVSGTIPDQDKARGSGQGEEPAPPERDDDWAV